MRRALFLFLDGVGLGEDDPAVNPLARGEYPTLRRLLEGRRAVRSTGRFSAAAAELVPTDAQLGVPGRPQSATGQAAILTGINAAQRLGEHYGPRPDDRVRAVVDEGNLFRRLGAMGRGWFFCNAYPQGYFEAVRRGKRLLSVVPYAATSAGQALNDHDDLVAGRALAADFTSAGWVSQLGYSDIPVYAPGEAGAKLWALAQPYQFLFFEHWQTDVLGHRGELAQAVKVLATFDAFLGGLLEAIDMASTLVIISSDHGNVEDCSDRRHTTNPAFTLILGAQRQAVAARVQTLTDFAPAILEFLSGG
ncbi:MAG: alkaline phosphatase family protein [Caldilineaceae bacterium]|nr:alkaline phosphatase family protein [Caldilineaceae bacterium]